MERIANVAILHFVVSIGSLFGFARIGGDDPGLLTLALKTVARLLTIPARQIGNFIFSPGAPGLWLLYLINSFLWAWIIIRLWDLVRRRLKTEATQH